MLGRRKRGACKRGVWVLRYFRCWAQLPKEVSDVNQGNIARNVVCNILIN